MTAHTVDRDHQAAVVRMGNDIARQLSYLGPEQAAHQLAAHILKFWEPRMLAQLVACRRRNDSDMDPLLLAASTHLSDGEDAHLEDPSGG